MSATCTFKFQYLKGQSAPHKTVDAPTDTQGYENIKYFLKEEGVKLVPGSIVRRTISSEPMPDEAAASGIDRSIGAAQRTAQQVAGDPFAPVTGPLKR